MITELRVTSIAYDPAGGSVAVLRDLGTKEQYRVRVGESLGRMRVARIAQKAITFTIEEFGYSRTGDAGAGRSQKGELAMRRIRTLAAVVAAVLGLGVGTASAAHIYGRPARDAVDPAAGAITALSVVPGDGQAEVVIALSGPVKVADFIDRRRLIASCST